ncbi:hypothetical protein F53441_10010 [Fusarium austroafricanum]|uniref:PD-(D/E)XK nuclease-like domain-containing protein n=1 Tax=Fusarium austroafricanum TaxID=2364996 RepID=A0A8H4NPN8_9HYPO|nr:hypothetical protein F53441_10010 [Fusarium austroafricanum]
MKKRIQATNNAAASNLWNSIWNVVGGLGYIPRELKDLLQEELQAFDTKFTTKDRIVNLTAQQQEDATQIFTSFNDEIKHQMSLYNELTTIRKIVADSADFIKWNRSEAAWNHHIQGPTLRLAMSTIAHVCAENITTASIDKDFPRLSTDIKTFVDAREGPKTFNQSTSEHLRYKPTGVFIETKSNMKRHSEGKVQLEIWLASWFERTAQFAATNKIPLMPVLLVVCARWELHFAFDNGTHYDVMGPVDVGGTGTVDDMYRLLAVLRLLGDWVGGEFREWHANIQDILAEAADASTMTKVESAWKAQVHYPILKLALSSVPPTRAETITNAQIIKGFRPKSQGRSWSSATSSATLSHASILSNDTGTYTELEPLSVHKMVDFALVPILNNVLEDKITMFLAN